MKLVQKFAIVGIFVFVCIGLVQSAAAWSRAGHMTTAAIAYDVLMQENPQVAAKVIAILKQHPQFERRWARQLDRVDPADRDQALYMLAARWPDDIRSDPDYDHPAWHYIDVPYKPAGQPDSVEIAPPPDPNIETAYRTNVEILKGTGKDAEKAVALCWIFHLTGDVHQPLHSVALFSTDYPAPKGDAGGTKAFIRVTEDSETINLHRFWDDLITGTEDTRDVKKVAIELRNKFPRAELDKDPQNVTPNDLPKWVEESLELAKSATYLEGKLATSPMRENAPVLPKDYVQNSKKIGERRGTQAGYRTADVLSRIFADSEPSKQ